jgi:hypothetical protein
VIDFIFCSVISWFIIKWFCEDFEYAVPLMIGWFLSFYENQYGCDLSVQRVFCCGFPHNVFWFYVVVNFPTDSSFNSMLVCWLIFLFVLFSLVVTHSLIVLFCIGSNLRLLDLVWFDSSFSLFLLQFDWFFYLVPLFLFVYPVWLTLFLLILMFDWSFLCSFVYLISSLSIGYSVWLLLPIGSSVWFGLI